MGTKHVPIILYMTYKATAWQAPVSVAAITMGQPIDVVIVTLLSIIQAGQIADGFDPLLIPAIFHDAGGSSASLPLSTKELRVTYRI